MNIIKFIESFTDDALFQAQTSRRNSFSALGNLGKKAAFAAIPGGLLGLLLVPQKGSAKTLLAPANDATPVQALQLALTLETLDSEFYQIGLDTAGLIPEGRDRTVFTKIVQNENAHRASILQALQQLGSHDNPDMNFDYTANGLFDPFNNYDQFLALAQSFEDTGVRAYKGQAHNLMPHPDILQTSLQIHSAEARQASEVRRLRGEKGWITGNLRGPGMDQATQPVYNGEDNITQAQFNSGAVNNGTAGPQIPGVAGSQAFDEPLTRDQVMSITAMFMP